MTPPREESNHTHAHTTTSLVAVRTPLVLAVREVPMNRMRELLGCRSQSDGRDRLRSSTYEDGASWELAVRAGRPWGFACSRRWTWLPPLINHDAFSEILDARIFDRNIGGLHLRSA